MNLSSSLCRGKGTNTRGELIALWCLSAFANEKEVQFLQVAGDSKVVVDWLVNRDRLQVLNLESWKQKTKHLVDRFTHLECQHIYRFYNQEAVDMSKKALFLSEGTLVVQEYKNSSLITVSEADFLIFRFYCFLFVNHLL